MNILGANWRTTIAGILAAGFAAYQTGSFTDPTDWKKWLLPVAMAVFGYLVKDKNVTGGSVQQTLNGAVVPASSKSSDLVDATLKATPAHELTPQQNSIKSKLPLIFAPLLALSLVGCENTAYIRGATAGAVAATIQYVVPTAQKGQVARNAVKASQIYSVISAGQVPDGAQLRLILDRYIPANPSKTITETALVSIYSGVVYPKIKDKVPSVAFENIHEYLYGISDGASPYVSLPWLSVKHRDGAVW